MSIEPTPGRIVHYHPAFAHAAPLAAIVVGVHSERLVNLTVYNDDGSTHPEIEVQLLQDDDAAPEGKPYAEWMAYQKGQAAKTESVAGDVHARLAAVETLLKTDGPIHGLFAQLQQDVATKFHETGAFLEAKFGEIDKQLAHAPAPPPETPPQAQPNPTPPAEGASQEHAADGQSQAQ